MAIETSVNIDVNVDGTATVKQAAQGFEDLGDAVAKTQREVEALALQYGINDQRTQEAIKRAGQYKGQLEQLDQAIDANKGGVDQLFRGVQGLAAGFEIAAGSLAIFGSESQELEKILIKVQGAMVLAQGLKDFKEFGGAIRGLVTLVGERLVAAFATLRTALISSGIGAAVVGVGLLVANFLRLREETAKAAEQQKKYNDELLKLRKERELLQKGDEQYTRDELKNVSDRLAAGQRELVEKVAARRKYLNDLRVLGIEEADSDRERAESNIKEIALNNERLVNERLKLQNKVTELEKQSAAKAKAERDLNYKSQNDDLKKSLDDKKRLEDEAFEQWIAQEVENDDYRQYLLQKRLAQEEEEFQNWIAQEIENDAYRTRKKQEEADKRKQIEEDLFNASQDLANAIISLAGEQSKIGKGIALAQVAADTARALSGALANSNSPTADNVATGGLAGIAKYITLAATILTNAKRARDIIKSGNTSYSAASPSLPSATVANATIRSSSLPQSENILATNRKVYVLEGDITRTQRIVKGNQSVSVLGG